MSPRALTEEEKQLQKNILLDSGRQLILQKGVANISVDDIVTNAKMAKGTFYNHFSSKEDMLLSLIWGIYSDFINEAKAIITNSKPETMRETVGEFIKSILYEPTKVFFFINHDDLEELLAGLDTEKIQNFNSLENQAFANLLQLAGIDIKTVRPEVVHNCIHAMYFAVSDKSIISSFMPETIDVMMAGLLDYIFGKEV